MSKAKSDDQKFFDLSVEELLRLGEKYSKMPATEATAEERAAFDRILKQAPRKPGRPRVGEGASRVLLTIERGLLRRTDAYAKRAGLSRAAIIAMALDNLLQRPKRKGA
jgi:hypothetical protein